MWSRDSLRKRLIGAECLQQGGVQFTLWAPLAVKAQLQLHGQSTNSPVHLSMTKTDDGYFGVYVPEAKSGDRYYFSIDDKNPLPDPASRFQPDGVHGPSEIVIADFAWSDNHWKGVTREQLTFYELHIGGFSKTADLRGAMEHLPCLRELGINAVEIMPVAQFSGHRNWGYDGVFPFATQNSYGGPWALKEFVDACHRHEMAVVLDVVYNHLGPEGNILPLFGPYFQDKYHTPWGAALNFDGPYSDEVKKYFCQNLLQWLDEFHFDGLRLDAVHAICDNSQRPLLEQLEAVKNQIAGERGVPLYLIAESDLNDPKILNSAEHGGFGLDMQWNDDFHHSLHVALTGEKKGYYQDFRGLEDLAETFRFGTAYRDRYSNFRHSSRGREFRDIAHDRFVVYSQNHDQIGNRPLGDRLTTEAGLEKQRLAASCVFLSPFAPLLFMGEEWAETRPFLYFVDHEDRDLVEAVRKGRSAEFKEFFEHNHEASSLGPPDPASLETFRHSQIDHESGVKNEEKRGQFTLYRKLIRFSKWLRREKFFESDNIEVILSDDKNLMQVNGRRAENLVVAVFHFGAEPRSYELQNINAQTRHGLKMVFKSSMPALEDAGSVGERLELEPYSACLLHNLKEAVYE